MNYAVHVHICGKKKANKKIEPLCFSAIEDMPFEDEDGDLRDKEDIAFRQEAINEKNHVTWNAERRCFISAEAAER